MSIMLSSPLEQIPAPQEPKMRVHGICACCGEEIVSYDDEEDYFYHFDGDVIHKNCLRRWAESFRVEV